MVIVGDVESNVCSDFRSILSLFAECKVSSSFPCCGAHNWLDSYTYNIYNNRVKTIFPVYYFYAKKHRSGFEISSINNWFRNTFKNLLFTYKCYFFRSSKGCNYRARIHSAYVCWLESWHGKDHLFTFHMCHRSVYYHHTQPMLIIH